MKKDHPIWPSIIDKELEIPGLFKQLEEVVLEVYRDCLGIIEKKLTDYINEIEGREITKEEFNSLLKVSIPAVPMDSSEPALYFATWRNEPVAVFTLPAFEHNKETNKAGFITKFSRIPYAPAFATTTARIGETE